MISEVPLFEWNVASICSAGIGMGMGSELYGVSMWRWYRMGKFLLDTAVQKQVWPRVQLTTLAILLQTGGTVS